METAVKDNLTSVIVRRLSQTGLKHSGAGYKYMITCIKLIIESGDRSFMIRHIYEETAARYNVQWTTVERAIRIAIHRASDDYKKLTNKEFISRIVDSIF